jgi:hypothetical protein
MNGGGRRVIEEYSSKRDSHGQPKARLHQCLGHDIRSHAIERVPAEKTEDTIDFSAYFAPPVMALYRTMVPSVK